MAATACGPRSPLPDSGLAAGREHAAIDHHAHRTGDDSARAPRSRSRNGMTRRIAACAAARRARMEGIARTIRHPIASTSAMTAHGRCASDRSALHFRRQRRGIAAVGEIARCVDHVATQVEGLRGRYTPAPAPCRGRRPSPARGVPRWRPSTRGPRRWHGRIEYTEAGCERLARSLTIAAAVYCTIMKPDSVASSFRSGCRQAVVGGRIDQLVETPFADRRQHRDRRLDVAHRQSQRHAWKWPAEMTCSSTWVARLSGNTSGLSVTALSSIRTPVAPARPHREPLRAPAARSVASNCPRLMLLAATERLEALIELSRP